MKNRDYLCTFTKMKMTSLTCTDSLNQILASYQLHYQNLRSLHWNVKGANFFELHLKYKELYTRTQIIIDEVAERILTLLATPLSRFSIFLQNEIRNSEFGIDNCQKQTQ